MKLMIDPEIHKRTRFNLVLINPHGYSGMWSYCDECNMYSWTVSPRSAARLTLVQALVRSDLHAAWRGNLHIVREERLMPTALESHNHTPKDVVNMEPSE